MVHSLSRVYHERTEAPGKKATYKTYRLLVPPSAVQVNVGAD
jgi:hypothetical protein